MDVTMPRLSDTMQEGTISEWLKKVGDRVEKGDVLAEIQTDKAVMELEAYEPGVLTQILVQAGDTVPIGTTVAVLGSGVPAEAAPAQPAAPAATTPPVALDAYGGGLERPLPPVGTKQSSDGALSHTNGVASNGTAHMVAAPGGRVKASPLARNMAVDLGVDIGQIGAGSGPNGRIMREDVENFVRAQGKSSTPPTQNIPSNLGTTTVAPQPAPAVSAPPAPALAPQATAAPVLGDGQERVAFTPMQRTVANRLAESKATTPHFYVSEEIDMTDLMVLRKEFNATAPETMPKVSVNDMMVKAAALALEAHPEVNTGYRDGGFLKNSHINVGIAVDVPNGLIVPVVRDANIKGVRQIARETKALIEKARAGKLRPEDYQGGTFSISNLGGMGVEQFIAVINPPEGAILAVGSVRQKVVVWAGEMAIRERMLVTISADHRVLYGAQAARFLATLKGLLEAPMNILG